MASNDPSNRRRGRPRTLHLRLTAAVALVAGSLAAGASAQVDTELTPVPKSSPEWTALGGARFDEGDALVKDSLTSFRVDFFSVAFSRPKDVGDPSIGLFGGWECPESTKFDELDECDAERRRRPVVFRLDNDPVTGEKRFERMTLPVADGRGGYVAAIAWIDSKRALAVGGSGIYPRREPPAAANDDAYAERDIADGAGRGRAWLYEDGSWREVEDVPDRALTAVECTWVDHQKPNLRLGNCLAGGLQRMWWWKPAAGEEAEGFDLDDTDTVKEVPNELGLLPDFHFRVRQIRFSQAPAINGRTPYAVASTSGCCASGGGASGARMLAYDGTPPKWTSSREVLGLDAASSQQGSPLPDSYFGLFYSPGKGASYIWALAVPGQAEAALEPGSRIVMSTLGDSVGLGGGLNGRDDVASETDPDLLDRNLDSVRLLAADGDYDDGELPVDAITRGGALTARAGSDGLFDWAVGGFKDSGQGAAYTTIPALLPLPTPFTCPDVLTAGQDALLKIKPPNCDVAADGVSGADVQGSSRLVALPTYTLNAFSYRPDSGGTEAWAAGDRGAIARLGGAGSLGSADEPHAPKLRAGTPTPLSDSSAFEPFRPASVSRQPGPIPRLAAQPLDELRAPSIEAYGTSDPTRWHFLRRESVSALALSRDGDEGWAIGSGLPYQSSAPFDLDLGTEIGGDRFTLQHFDGERWSKCLVDGLNGAFDADAACDALTPLLKTNPTLKAIARIPLERDDESSNNDDFEALAVGTPSDATTAATLLSYRDGEWKIEDHGGVIDSVGGPTGVDNASVEVGFRAPDDGWLVTNGTTATVYHYGPDERGRGWPHGRWVECFPTQGPKEECGANLKWLKTDVSVLRLRLQIAGDRVLLAGIRTEQVDKNRGAPFVFSKAGEGDWQSEWDPGCADPESGNPCTPKDSSVPLGTIHSLSATDLGGGRVAGWLLGRFGGALGTNSDEYHDTTRELDRTTPASAGRLSALVLARRDPDSDSWTWREVDDDAAHLISFQGTGTEPRLVSFRGDDGSERSFVVPPLRRPDQQSLYPPLEYDPGSDRWNVLSVPWVSSPKGGSMRAEATQGIVRTAAPDNKGGLWLVGEQPVPSGYERNTQIARGSYFYRYGDSRRRPVYEEAPSPVSEPISGLAGTPEGGVWVATRSDRVYRYDRLKGWERLRIKGWDPGRIVTKPSSALAVAVNESGDGVVVGEGGRIADLSRTGVTLDPASGRRCSDVAPPCGTPRTLSAAAVAPDGSAMVGGDRLALVWRPAGGPFRLIERPSAIPSARVTGIAMPRPDSAWITLDAGEVWAGRLIGTRWVWGRETRPALAADERRSTKHPDGRAQLNAIALDSDGAGLAVGDRGAILERSGDGSWRRLETGYLDSFHSIALPPAGYGDGTLIGGSLGLILTRQNGELGVARQSDITHPLTVGPGGIWSARIVGLTLAGGSDEGDVESWAASQVPFGGPFSTREPKVFGLLHGSSGDDPLLRPMRRLRPIPDAPAPEPGELTLAAFGRSECQLEKFCNELQGNNLFHERLIRGVQGELGRRRQRTDGPLAAVFTGDISALPGRGVRSREEPPAVGVSNAPADANMLHSRWRDSLVRPLAEDGVPLFAAIGKADLSRVVHMVGVSEIDTQEFADAGVSLQWRKTFADMPQPWGSGELASDGSVEFRPVPDRTIRVEAPGGGARTHYALDVERGGDRVARLIFIDNSFGRSLTAGEASQNPIDVRGGQAAWLERMLCVRGETCSSGGSREPGLPAVVVSNAPTYSYGPGGLEAAQADGSVLEGLLLRHKASAVVSGRLGWNGLFYTLAPGVHSPCPGGGYPARKPDPATVDCESQAGNTPSPPSAPAATELANALRGVGAPVPTQVDAAAGTATDLQAAIPNVIASSAGGRFGPDGGEDGEASDGFWHGYSVVRVRRSGDVVVEQRPIFDWITITAQEHTLKPGQKLTLRGYGREPLGTDTSVRLDRIDSAAITHRYDLLAADPDKPYLPRQDADGNYVPLEPGIATIDEQSGVVRAGKGRQQRTYAIALLSVGDKTASWPLVFEPAKSFRPRPATSTTVAPPARAIPAAPVPPGIVVAAQSPTQPPPTAPPASPIATPGVNLELPPPPSLPPIGSAPTAASPAPPPPPAPPAPPSTGEALPLSLEVPITPVSIVPTVIPPTPPPINPAPPGGSAARKEARQRQAATAKSEEGGGQAKDAGVESVADGPPSPTGTAMTRRDRVKPGPSFTPLRTSEQASAWVRGGLYGGATAVLAFALAAGWIAGRPQRRTPASSTLALRPMRKR